MEAGKGPSAELKAEAAAVTREAKSVLARLKGSTRRLTKKELAARRGNAQKSTGPITDAGRAKAAKNALKHGLFSRENVFPGESRRRFFRFARRMLEQLAPVGEIEVQLASRVVSLLWRLRRVNRLERDLLGRAEGDGEGRLADNLRLVDAYVQVRRHEAQIDRAVFRTWRELKQFQAARREKERVRSAIVRDLERRVTERTGIATTF